MEAQRPSAVVLLAGLRRRWLGLAPSAVFALSLAAPPPAHGWSFSDVTAAAGLSYTHAYTPGGPFGDLSIIAGGVAAGDFDRDGFVDLFVVLGSAGPARLYRNRGDGTFVDVAPTAGVAIGPGNHSSATFADVDGDGWLDLLALGTEGVTPRLFLNQRDGTFDEATGTAGIVPTKPNTFSASFGDYDRDGDLDLFISQWSGVFTTPVPSGFLWRNDGAGAFTDVSQAAGIPIFNSR